MHETNHPFDGNEIINALVNTKLKAAELLKQAKAMLAAPENCNWNDCNYFVPGFENAILSLETKLAAEAKNPAKSLSGVADDLRDLAPATDLLNDKLNSLKKRVSEEDQAWLEIMKEHDKESDNVILSTTNNHLVSANAAATLLASSVVGRITSNSDTISGLLTSAANIANDVTAAIPVETNYLSLAMKISSVLALTSLVLAVCAFRNKDSLINGMKTQVSKFGIFGYRYTSVPNEDVTADCTIKGTLFN